MGSAEQRLSPLELPEDRTDPPLLPAASSSTHRQLRDSLRCCRRWIHHQPRESNLHRRGQVSVVVLLCSYRSCVRQCVAVCCTWLNTHHDKQCWFPKETRNTPWICCGNNFLRTAVTSTHSPAPTPSPEPPPCSFMATLHVRFSVTSVCFRASNSQNQRRTVRGAPPAGPEPQCPAAERRSPAVSRNLLQEAPQNTGSLQNTTR